MGASMSFEPFDPDDGSFARWWLADERGKPAPDGGFDTVFVAFRTLWPLLRPLDIFGTIGHNNVHWLPERHSFRLIAQGAPAIVEAPQNDVPTHTVSMATVDDVIRALGAVRDSLPKKRDDFERDLIGLSVTVGWTRLDDPTAEPSLLRLHDVSAPISIIDGERYVVTVPQTLRMCDPLKFAYSDMAITLRANWEPWRRPGTRSHAAIAKVIDELCSRHGWELIEYEQRTA